MGPLGMRKVTGSIAKIIVTTAIMGWIVWGISKWTPQLVSGDDLIARLIHVLLPLTAGLIIYILIAFITGQKELKELLNAYLSKKR